MTLLDRRLEMKGMMKLHFYIISIPLPTQSRVTANSEEEAGGGGGGDVT